MQMPAQVVLRKVAARYREHHGSWCQHWGRTSDGALIANEPTADILARIGPTDPCCIDVAIRLIGADYGGPVVIEQARRMVYNQLGYDHLPENLFDWNDAEGRTVEEVIAMLEAAADAGNSSPTWPERIEDGLKRLVQKTFAAIRPPALAGAA